MLFSMPFNVTALLSKLSNSHSTCALRRSLMGLAISDHIHLHMLQRANRFPAVSDRRELVTTLKAAKNVRRALAERWTPTALVCDGVPINRLSIPNLPWAVLLATAPLVVCAHWYIARRVTAPRIAPVRHGWTRR
jgi:hypothetical protein